MSISLSVISHGHGEQVVDLLNSIVLSGWGQTFQCEEVLLTLNLPESALKDKIQARAWPFRLVVIENNFPRGFGQNHNRAFFKSTGDLFAVVNPDIKFLDDFDHVVNLSPPDCDVGVWVPRQLDAAGCIQDYCRKSITPFDVVRRVLARCFGGRTLAGVSLGLDDADWVNAACLIFPRRIYRELNGFDENYYMYCEDVDFCLRLRLSGFRFASAPFSVVHVARRQSLLNLRHFFWHTGSLYRLWTSKAFWQHRCSSFSK